MGLFAFLSGLFGAQKKSAQLQIAPSRLRKILRVLDKLLSKLPKEEINSFARSEDFVLYGKVMAEIFPDGVDAKYTEDSVKSPAQIIAPIEQAVKSPVLEKEVSPTTNKATSEQHIAPAASPAPVAAQPAPQPQIIAPAQVMPQMPMHQYPQYPPGYAPYPQYPPAYAPYPQYPPAYAPYSQYPPGIQPQYQQPPQMVQYPVVENNAPVQPIHQQPPPIAPTVATSPAVPVQHITAQTVQPTPAIHKPSPTPLASAQGVSAQTTHHPSTLAPEPHPIAQPAQMQTAPPITAQVSHEIPPLNIPGKQSTPPPNMAAIKASIEARLRGRI